MEVNRVCKNFVQGGHTLVDAGQESGAGFYVSCEKSMSCGSRKSRPFSCRDSQILKCCCVIYCNPHPPQGCDGLWSYRLRPCMMTITPSFPPLYPPTVRRKVYSSPATLISTAVLVGAVSYTYHVSSRHDFPP